MIRLRRHFFSILQNVFENDRLFLSDLEIQGVVSFQFIKYFLNTNRGTRLVLFKGSSPHFTSNINPLQPGVAYLYPLKISEKMLAGDACLGPCQTSMIGLNCQLFLQKNLKVF